MSAVTEPTHHTLSPLRRVFSLLVEGLPEARYEAVLAVLRAACLMAGGGVLLVTNGGSGLAVPVAVNLALGVLSLVVAGWVSRAVTAESARRVGLICTVADVLGFAVYSIAFGQHPGAGGVFGVFVLLEGPLRYGLVGVPATVVPVALTAIAWPQLDAAGSSSGPGQVVALCALFVLPALVVRALVTRGSARLRQAELQFTTAFEHASIGMALVDLDLRVLQANRALSLLMGQVPSTMLGSSLGHGVDKLDRHRAVAVLKGLTSEEPSARLEVRVRRPDGGLRWGHVSATLLTGSGGLHSRIVVQVENITERKRSEAMLSHAAAHDALTDLPNRSLLLSRLEAALVHGDQVGILFLDLDRFKVVNDGLGHAAGDLLLVQVAIRLREAMRPEDMVARLGGDEFVVLCRNADLEVCTSVAARVLAVLNQPVTSSGAGELVVGGSIGIALAGPGDSAELVLRDADTAMYAAKQAGGGRSHVFSTELRDAAVRTHELEVDLRAALRNRDLRVVYQPVMSLADGRLLGCEALARWEHPRRGHVPAMEFIGVAEQSDLILDLGELVLTQALADLASWPVPESGLALTLAVNVSLRQLVSPGFAERVAELIGQSGVAPDRLCLEVTETALAGDVEHVVAALQELRAVGVRLSIDDFGTGHASLTYLARFPVDQVKVDQSFVAGLGVDPGSAAIVGGVVAMAQSFDLRVVAEGVESELQLRALRDMGCDAAQGHLLGVPMDAHELAFLLRRRVADGLVPLPRGAGAEALSSAEVRHTSLLVEGAKSVTGRIDLASVLEQAFSTLGASVAFDGGSILLVDGEQLRVAAALPAPAPEVLAARTPLGHGLAGSIAVTGEPTYLADRAALGDGRSGSWFGVALIAEGRPIGVLQVDASAPGAFSESDRLAILSFAPVVTLAVVTASRATQQLHEIQRG